MALFHEQGVHRSFAPEAPAAPQEERAADLCVVAELVEIQMSIARATQQEALQRAAARGRLLPADRHRLARRAWLTLLLKDKLSRQAEEKRKAAALARVGAGGLARAAGPAGDDGGGL